MNVNFETKYDYDELSRYVIENIDSHLPEKYLGMVKADIVTKTNGVKLHGIRLECPEMEDDGRLYCPTVYLESFEFDWPDNICKIIAKALVNSVQKKKELPEFSRELILKTARLYIVNKEKNDLSFAREFEDLLVGIRCMFKVEDGVGSMILTKQVAELYNITEAEAFKAAETNTSKAAMIKNLHLYMFEMSMPVYSPDFMKLDMDTVNQLKDFLPEPKTMIVAGDELFHSAATILCGDVQERLSAIFEGRDFFVFPSSVHECIALEVPDDAECDDIDISELQSVVREINENCLPGEEFLSNSVYRYTKGKGLYLVN